jgi:hypothetical protein
MSVAICGLAVPACRYAHAGYARHDNASLGVGFIMQLIRLFATTTLLDRTSKGRPQSTPFRRRPRTRRRRDESISPIYLRF